MSLPWKLTKILVAIFGKDRVKNRRVFTPDFSASSFAQLAAGKKLPDLSREQIVDSFLNREQPDFFVAFDQVLPLANEIKLQYPGWVVSIVDTASTMSNQGLAIYNTLAAPLDGQFPWEGLRRGRYDDQLYLSRPQRFGFAPVLAQAALFDRRFVKILDDILIRWQHYALTSTYRWPYNSNHAVVYRVIALCFCWLFVGAIDKQRSDSSSKSVLYSILAILKNDILYLGPRLGMSHPNNHLLADYFVGWLLQHMFSELIPASMDFSGFDEKWQAELERQFYSDGASFEHAIHYHEHGCELVMIYSLLADSKSIPPGIDEHIGKILRFQARLNGLECRPWALGDTTEDTLLPLDHTQGWSSRAILAVHNCLFPEQALPLSGAEMDQKGFWLLAGKVASPQNKGVVLPVVEDYPDGGFVHWLNRSDRNELLFRTGVSPQTDFSPGHMHSDILSLYWRVEGVDILASSGTHSYRFAQREEGSWRDYFCGPTSHSGVIVDGKDPLGTLHQDFRRGDNGLRVSHNLYGDSSIASLCIAEVHSDNCYNGLKRGVVHLPDGYSLVLDIFTEFQRTLRVSSGWQFDKALDILCSDDMLELRFEDRVVARIISQQGTTALLHKGEISPYLGWQSVSYGVRSPTHYASFPYIQGTAVCASVLTSQCDKLHCEVDYSLTDTDRVVVNLVYEFGQDTIYLGLADTEQVFDIEGVKVKSRAVIHQQRQQASDKLVVIDCTFIGREARAVQNYSPGKTLGLEKSGNTRQWELV